MSQHFVMLGDRRSVNATPQNRRNPRGATPWGSTRGKRRRSNDEESGDGIEKRAAAEGAGSGSGSLFGPRTPFDKPTESGAPPNVN